MNMISEIEMAINKSIEEVADDEIEKATKRFRERLIAYRSDIISSIMTNICIEHDLPSGEIVVKFRMR